MDDYQKREEDTGLGKMKWEAAVRMKQAKLKSQGREVSKEDMIESMKQVGRVC